MRWDPSFFRRSPLFWPVASAASSLEKCERWPEPDELTKMFAGEPPVRFERARPKPRRRPSSPEVRYDARIAIARRVPTRPESWHDVSNALVWASFPRSKLALHERQHRTISARLGDDGRLPSARTSEQDAIAMMDEGGVVVVCVRNQRSLVDSAMACDTSRELARLAENAVASVILFGHGIYESLVRKRSLRVRAAAYLVEVDSIDADAASRVHIADVSLATLLSRPDPIDRTAFASLAIDEHIADRATFSGSSRTVTAVGTHEDVP